LWLYAVYTLARRLRVLAVITVRVPDRLRKEMRKVKSVNWSAVLRAAIEARIQVERRATARDWELVRQAGARADAIYNEMASKYGYIDFNSAETIRYWREARSRGMSQTLQSQ
jgi:hypothetical protein